MTDAERTLRDAAFVYGNAVIKIKSDGGASVQDYNEALRLLTAAALELVKVSGRVR